MLRGALETFAALRVAFETQGRNSATSMLHINGVGCIGSPAGTSDAEDRIGGNHSGAASAIGPSNSPCEISRTVRAVSPAAMPRLLRQIGALPPVGIEAGQMQSQLIRACDRFAASVANHQQALAVRCAPRGKTRDVWRTTHAREAGAAVNATPLSAPALGCDLIRSEQLQLWQGGGRAPRAPH